ncbi:MAG: alkaline phosphatase family protein [Janthinobacterium lividum]
MMSFWRSQQRSAAGLGLAALTLLSASAGAQTPTPARNVVIFVTDGLRANSVNPTVAPTLTAIKANGVSFSNSHSLFPTFTTPNASAIATGHYLGDTGDFSNTIYTPFPIFNTGNFGNLPGTTTPFVESNQVLSDIDDHFGGNYLTEETLLAYARQHGYSTAAIGKIGPIAIQDVTQVNVDPTTKKFKVPTTVIIDDATGTANTGVPLAADVQAALTSAGLTLVATPRNQPSGTNTTPGTTNANIGQQKYFADAAAKAVLPLFKTRNVPFALVYWSRDPDGTQHNQGDSLNKLSPGINGPTSRAAINNADTNLAEIIQALKDNGEFDNTDIFVTADHGFNTISHHELDTAGTVTSSYAAQQHYINAAGVNDVNAGFTPVGFLAIDLAHDLGMSLYDPDSSLRDTSNNPVSYEPVNATKSAVAVKNAQGNLTAGSVEQHPAAGDGLIGGTGAIPQIGQSGGLTVTGANFAVTDSDVVIAANGGSDLIYLPNGTLAERIALAKQVVGFLVQKDYVSGVFADDAFGSIPGTLPESAINFKGTTSLPAPALVVNFRTFSIKPTDPALSTDPLLNAIQFADSGLQEGQGMHGSFDRADTFNFTAAMGPDFKSGYVDNAPVSNADVQVTIANVLGFTIPSVGKLQGRVIGESLLNGADVPAASIISGTLRSQPAPNGQRTTLRYQQLNGVHYFDAAGFPGRTVGL